MITIKEFRGKANEDIMSIVGLSTDTKPTKAFQNLPIENGSDFYCMDTKQVFLYDKANNIWLEQ